jgi:hypothetical protein
MSPSKFLKRRKPQKPPIEDRHHWREELTLQARHIRAGDAYIVKGGRTRRFLHICESSIEGNMVKIKYNDAKLAGGFGSATFKSKDRVQVRRNFHD